MGTTGNHDEVTWSFFNSCCVSRKEGSPYISSSMLFVDNGDPCRLDRFSF